MTTPVVPAKLAVQSFQYRIHIVIPSVKHDLKEAAPPVLLSKATEGDSEGRQVALGLLSVVFYKHPTQVAEGDHPPKGGSPPGLLGKATEGDSEGRQPARAVRQRQPRAIPKGGRSGCAQVIFLVRSLSQSVKESDGRFAGLFRM